MIDLNCDLGERLAAWPGADDADLFALITSANLACGFHAGDPVTMLESIALASANGVAIGAHPGYRDLIGFGRRAIDMSADELFADVLYQVSALQGLAGTTGATVRYLKPHGALYSRIGHDEQQADAVARVAATTALPLVGQPGTAIEAAAAASGVRFVREGFVDRGYLSGGRLAPRGTPGSLVLDPPEAGRRAVRMARDGLVETIDGTVLELEVETLCVHGDSPGAAAILAGVRGALADAGVEVRAFG